jgi:N-acetylmuramoyl-L-alanine amidase
MTRTTDERMPIERMPDHRAADGRGSDDAAAADEDGALARAVFRGLAPRTPAAPAAEPRTRGPLSTVPIVLVGSMAVGATLTGSIPVIPHSDHAPDDERRTPSDASAADAATVVGASAPSADATPGEFATAAAPATYTVVRGDTVSAIAGRFGLSTASVLGLNGLSARSIIHPGQVLRLTTASAAPAPAPAPAPAAGGSHTIARGDTVSAIAARYRVTVRAVLDANGLKATSIIYPGQVLRIPGAAAPAPAAPTAPVAAPAPAPAPVTTASYRIRSGDTITGIARSTGVSVAALLAANGLTPSSVIYAGRSLVIPGIVAVAAVTPRPAPAPSPAPTTAPTPTLVAMSAEMRRNAEIIVAVGRSLGVSDRGLVIALAAAMQESSLRNIDYGDRDSVGLFQQRPSAGWGAEESLLDPAHAARLFFGGPSNPNTGVTRGLLDIAGWEGMTLTRAAQAVQISAYPDAYARWEASAALWLTQL